MYSKGQLAVKYLRYYFSSSNGKGHGTHSPFIYHFIRKVLNDRQEYPAYTKVEALRKQLLDDRSVLEIDDFGAGSTVSNKKQRSISSIAAHSAKPAKYGQLLYRIAKSYQSNNMLELGTSLGISTAYLSLGNPGATVITMEGAPAIAAVAKKNSVNSG